MNFLDIAEIQIHQHAQRKAQQRVNKQRIKFSMGE